MEMALDPPDHGLHPEDEDDHIDLYYDDELVYKKALKMHGHRQMQPGSLKDYCMHYYISNAEEWLSIKDETSVNIFDFMPTFLRAQLLKYLAESSWFSDDPVETVKMHLEAELICPFINLVMKKDIKSMHLGSMVDTFEFDDSEPDITEGVIDILSKLSKESPNLQEFSFGLYYRQYSIDQHQLLDHFLYFCEFKNLTVLSLRALGVIDFSSVIGNQQVEIMSFNFPLLVCLRLELDESINLEALVASLSNLKRLRFFLYVLSKTGKKTRPKKSALEDKVFNYLVMGLPHLEYLRRVVVPELREHMLFCRWEHSVVLSGTSQLHQLCTSGGLPEASLPNLNHLCFKGPILDMEQFFARISLYKNLTTLELANVGEKHLCRLLQLVGHQLTVLLLSSPIRFADLKIVQLCPRLMKLQNIGCYQFSLKSFLGYADKRNAERMLCFLKSVNLDFQGTRAPHGLFKLLLASPKLEKFYIKNVLFSVEDCNFFSQLRCHSLQRLFLTDLKPPRSCSVGYLEMMVRGLVIHLPSLAHMIINLHRETVEDWPPFQDWTADIQTYLNMLRTDTGKYICSDAYADSEDDMP